MKEGSSLKWRCRRGIREMDILFQRFLEKYFDNLSSEEQKIFEQLLDESDVDIMAWIMGKAKPANKFEKFIKLLSEANSENN